MCAGEGMSCDIVTSAKITVNGIWPNVRRSNCAARFVELMQVWIGSQPEQTAACLVGVLTPESSDQLRDPRVRDAEM